MEEGLRRIFSMWSYMADGLGVSYLRSGKAQDRRHRRVRLQVLNPGRVLLYRQVASRASHQSRMEVV